MEKLEIPWDNDHITILYSCRIPKETLVRKWTETHFVFSSFLTLRRQIKLDRQSLRLAQIAWCRAMSMDLFTYLNCPKNHTQIILQANQNLGHSMKSAFNHQCAKPFLKLNMGLPHRNNQKAPILPGIAAAIPLLDLRSCYLLGEDSRRDLKRFKGKWSLLHVLS